MAEYIERDKAVQVALEACVEVCKDITGHGITQIHAVEITEKIENVPAADVVEVVRCKNCYYYNENKGICTNTACVKSFYGCKVKEDDYCSYGKRRKD